MAVIFTYTVPTSLVIDPRRDPDVTVSTQLNPGGNSVTLTENAEPQFSQFELDDPVTSKPIFKGSISVFVDSFEEQPSQLVHSVTGIDGSWTFNKHRPFGTFAAVSLNSVVTSLVTKYAPDFTTNHVQTGLPLITITFTGEETMDQAITRATQLAGNCRWYKDFNNDVHCFHVDPPTLPAIVGPSIPSRAGAASAMTVAQSGSLIDPPPPAVSSTFTGGGYLFACQFEYDDGQLSKYSEWTPVLLDGAHKIDFSSIPIGSAVGGHNVVARRVYGWLQGPNAAGARNSSPFAWFRIPDNTTTAVAGTNFGGIWKTIGGITYTWALGSFLPFYGYIPPQALTPEPGPIAGPTVANGASYSTFSYTPGAILVAYSFVYADGQESDASPATAFTADGIHVPNVTIGTGSARPSDSMPCIARKVYWCYGVYPTYTPNFADHTNPGDVLGYSYVMDNTSTSTEWVITFSGIFAQNSAAIFSDLPLGYGTTPGPNPENDGNNPEDITDSSTLLLKDPPFQVQYDKSQIRNRVFVRGATVNATAPASAGGIVVSLPLNHPFVGVAGQVFIKDRVYSYASVTATSIILSQALAVNIVAGDIVGLWAQVDDVAAQAWLAEQEDGDGVHEYTIVDTSLATIAACTNRGVAELALFSRPIVTAQYATRDVKSYPGRFVNINLTNPPYSGTLLIQTAQIDQWDYTSDHTLQPRYQVTASNVMFSLDDFLRNAALISQGGASGVGSTGATSGGTGGTGGGVVTSGTAENEVPTGAINGSNTVFTTAHSYIAGSTKVFIRGVRQTLGTDYTESAAATITFTTAPQTGDSVFLDYRY